MLLKVFSIMTNEMDCKVQRNCSKQEDPNPNTSTKDRRGTRTNIQGPTQWGLGSRVLLTILARLLGQNASSRRSRSTPLLGLSSLLVRLLLPSVTFSGHFQR